MNVTVTDGSGIAGVVIDLSAIGGSTVQPMTYMGNNIWSATTNASAGTPPKTYDLPVCATDIHGYVNMSESVELVVMRNGDVTGDDDLTPDDVALLANYVTYPGRYTISSEFVADVTDDGVVDIADAMQVRIDARSGLWGAPVNSIDFKQTAKPRVHANLLGVGREGYR